jgi:hypothetical protein
MTTIIIDNRSILNSFNNYFIKNTKIKIKDSMNNLIMRIIEIKEKVIIIYNINKWMTIMIKKRRNLKIKSINIITIISIIKTILKKIIKLTSNQNKIIEKRIAIKNKNFKSMHKIKKN